MLTTPFVNAKMIITMIEIAHEIHLRESYVQLVEMLYVQRKPSKAFGPRLSTSGSWGMMCVEFGSCPIHGGIKISLDGKCLCVI